MSIPLYSMNSADAGNDGTENATISLGGYLDSGLLAPFNAVNYSATTTTRRTRLCRRSVSR